MDKIQLRETRRYHRYANLISTRFDEWKDIDEFYFITLYMDTVHDYVRLGPYVRAALGSPSPDDAARFRRFRATHPRFQGHSGTYRLKDLIELLKQL